MVAFAGKYSLVSNENLDKFLAAFDVDPALIGAACAAKPNIELSESGGVWTFKTDSGAAKSQETKFKLDEEFDDVSQDGRKCKSIYKIDGNKLIKVQKGEKGKEATISAEFSGDGIVMTCSGEGVTAKRVFKRV